MKPVLLICFIFFAQFASAQSLDYISIRKKNGRVVKNFYTGSTILLQTSSGGYLQGPIQTIKNDSVFVGLYDIREVPTVWGSRIRDTVSFVVVGINYKEIERVQLSRKQNFLQRTGAPLLIIGGGSYLALNLLNGALFNDSITDSKNVKKLSIAGSMIGIGYLIKKLFSSDGFSSKKHKITYVNL